MKNKNFGRKRQAIYILSNRKSTRIIKTLMDFFFFIKVKIKMVCFSVPSQELQGAPWVQAALHESLGNFGPLFITVAMVLFAFTTLLGNCFYCDNLLNYIHKGQPSKTFMKGFRIVSALVVFIGAGMEVSMLWNISDVLMGVMALINIPVILILSNTALKALADYEKQKKNGENPVFKTRNIGLEYETDYWS